MIFSLQLRYAAGDPARSRTHEAYMVCAVEAPDEARTREAVPYQTLLRSIGAILDQEGAAQVSVVETEEDFLVRYQARYSPQRVMSSRLGTANLTLWDRRRRGHRS